MAHAIEEQQIELNAEGGRKMPLFIAGPTGDGDHPGVIVIHEIFGLNDHIKDIARRFARAGFLAYAPDLFDDTDGLPDNRNDLAGMRAVWSKIPDQSLIADLTTVLAQMPSSCVGTIGYCMGGAIAYMFACSNNKVAWVADYYGRVYYPELSATKPKHPIEYSASLKCPVIGLFAGEDELITVDHVKQLEQRVQEVGQPTEIKIYENAKHAFFNDQREFYNEEAAKDAWKRTLDFIACVAKVRITAQ